jgi:hypothetical protein
MGSLQPLGKAGPGRELKALGIRFGLKAKV